MKRALAKRTIKLATWVVILSIVGLTLSSFFPWISVEEDDNVKETLHFNKAMMETSDNDQIKNLSGHLNLINLLFWLLIVFGLIFIIGMITHATGKHPSLAPIMMLIGLENLIVSILIIVLQIFFLKTVNDIETLSLSPIISPIKYAYIPLTFSFILLINTIVYTKVVVVPLIKLFKQSTKQKKSTKNEQKQIPKQPVKTTTKKPPVLKEKQQTSEKTLASNMTNEKRHEMEKWLTGQVQKMDKKDIPEKPPEPEREKEEQVEISEEIIEEKPISENQTEPFSEEQQETEEPHEPDEHISDQTFENALSSAIEKKQMEKQKEGTVKKETIEIKEGKPVEKTIPELQVVPTEPKPEAIVEETPERQNETEEKQESDKKKIGIKCPECNHKFSFVLGEDVTKIKCPNCGKEGVLE